MAQEEITVSINLADIDGQIGFRLEGVALGDRLGYGVTGIGDFNRDGFADVVVSAAFADGGGNNAGASYVVFGMAGGFKASLDLADLDGSNGFRLDGLSAEVAFGRSTGAVIATRDENDDGVLDGGDFNGDGFADLIIGAQDSDFNGQNSGSVYVIFGTADNLGASFDVATLNGSNGFRLDGAAAIDNAGRSVSGAGDLNKDGFGDLVIGAPSASNNGLTASGSAYVVFGSDQSFPQVFSLAGLNGANGFRLDGVGVSDSLGAGVAGVGDINGDDIDDLLVGATFADPLGAQGNAGAAYVLYGKTTAFPDRISVATLYDDDGDFNNRDNDGFRIEGAADSDFIGRVVSRAGDVNGDGINDLLLGSATHSEKAGEPNIGAAFVLYGRDQEQDSWFAPSVSLAAVGAGGLRLDGVTAEDNTGWDASGAGDVNGDGFDDLIIGAYGADPNGAASGTAYVVFGSGSLGGVFDLADLDGSNGFRLDGAVAGDQAGWEVGAAGDVNQDGFDDLILGAIGADPNGNVSGAAYVVLGRHVNTAPQGEVLIFGNAVEGSTLTVVNTLSDVDGLGAVSYQWLADGVAIEGATADSYLLTESHVGQVITVVASYTDGFGTEESVSSVPTDAVLEASQVISLADVGGDTGFRLDGAAAGDQAGWAVSNAGDVNGDGYDDLLIGAHFADDNGGNAGAAYVVFGKPEGFEVPVNLGELNGTDGFALFGEAAADEAGYSVSAAGDVNGDGYADIIVGAQNADANGVATGAAYVVFGKAGGFIPALALTDLDGSNGFRLDGEAVGDNAGWSVGGGGDINGDGYADVIVGARNAQPNGSQSGSTYVVFGKAGGFAASFDLVNLKGSDGFRVDGALAADRSGVSVSHAGDVNNDTFDDLIIGAYRADNNGISSGSSYVVFGRGDGFSASLDLADIDGSNGFRLDGAAAGDDSGWSVSGAGDVNGDGVADLLIGSPSADNNGSASGSAYVVFGRADGFPTALDLGSLDGSNGFRVDGMAADDNTAIAVSRAGDVNSDGLDDLLIGAYLADNSFSAAGSAYVVFGRSDGFAAVLDLNELTRSEGFRLDGEEVSDNVGWSVSAAGDVDGDGIDDVIVGGYRANPNGDDSGSAWILFGTHTNVEPVGEVTISGDLLEGETLSVTNSLEDADGLGEISYQWYANGTPIEGATSDTLLLTENEAGRVITVAASYTDGFGTEESVVSSPTAPVQALPDGILVEGGPGPDVLSGGEGNDTVFGYGGRDTLTGLGGDDQLYGGDDIDHVLYDGARADYAITNQAGQLTVAGPEADGTDRLFGIERLHFRDISQAFDLEGNAGLTVKLLGTVLGAPGAADTALRGIAINIFDNEGLSFEQVMDIAIDVVLDQRQLVRSNESVVNLLWDNLVGGPTPQEVLSDLVWALDNGIFTQAELAVEASARLDELGVIDLGQLTLVGVDYQPVG